MPLAVATLLLSGHYATAQPERQPAPIERRPPASQPAQNTFPQRQNPPASNGNGRQVQAQGHLSQWMDTHRSLTLAQQQSALENEPGFRTLKPAEQQRMHQRLQQLNLMPPQQQQRVIERTEAMERLAPPQRQQIRGATAQLGSLPADRRRAVAAAFHSALQLPEGQRQQWVNSPQMRSQFNDQERSALTNLLQVAPVASQAGLPGFSPRVPPPPPPRYGPPQ